MTEMLTAAAIQGGVFVIAVWLICAAFRRLPAWVKAWLWWIACAQFLARLFITVPIAVSVPQTVSTPPVTSAATEKVTYITLDGAPNEVPLPTSPDLVLALWLAGVAVGTGVVVFRLWGAHRLVRTAVPLHDEGAREVLASLLREGEKQPRLLESARVKCPLLAGCLRPAIVVPSGYVQSHDPVEVRMAFAHELAHVRRHDLWLTIVVAAVQTVFFFHPLAWLAAREAAIAREEACDADVLRRCGTSPGAYAQFLLKSAQARTPVAAMGAAYGYRNLRRRITMLNSATNSSVRRTWFVMVAAGIIAALPWSVVAQQSTTSQVKVNPPKPVISRAIKPQGAKTAVAKPQKKKVVTAVAAKPAVDMPVTTQKSTPATGWNLPAATVPPRDSAIAVEAKSLPSVIVARSANAPVIEERTISANSSDVSPVAEPPRANANQYGAEIEAGPGDDGLTRLVRVKVERTDLEDAIVMLLRKTGTNFVIKAKIQPELITCGFNNISAEQALESILKGADQPLTYRMEGGIVFIISKEGQ